MGHGKRGAIALLVLALMGCGDGAGNGGGGENDPAAVQGAGGSALAAAPAAFGQCASCHSVQPGKHGLGPSVFGVHGAKAAQMAGFDYSAPLKSSGLVWDDATLDKWLEAPMEMVPGTKMAFGGIKDQAKRQEIIAYLKTLK